MTYRERFFIVKNSNCYVDARLYEIYSEPEIGYVINSTYGMFWMEMQARGYGGGGGPVDVKVYEVKNMLVVNISLLSDFQVSKLKNSFDMIKDREIFPIFEELGFPKCNQRNCKHPEHPYEYVKPEEVSFDRIMPDRRELDKIVFEALGLTEEEQLEVYRAVLELVKNRLLKAKSK